MLHRYSARVHRNNIRCAVVCSVRQNHGFFWFAAFLSVTFRLRFRQQRDLFLAVNFNLLITSFMPCNTAMRLCSRCSPIACFVVLMRPAVSQFAVDDHRFRAFNSDSARATLAAVRSVCELSGQHNWTIQFLQVRVCRCSVRLCPFVPAC